MEEPKKEDKTESFFINLSCQSCLSELRNILTLAEQGISSVKINIKEFEHFNIDREFLKLSIADKEQKLKQETERRKEELKKINEVLTK